MLADSASPSWVLLTALAALALVSLTSMVVFIALWRRARSELLAALALLPQSKVDASPPRGGAEDGRGASSAPPAPQDRARSGTAAVSFGVGSRATRAEILQVLGQRCPAGWDALLLVPPPRPRRTVWHVHLRPAVALDLADGRTVPATPPPSDQEWTLPSGRKATLAVGEVSPPPSPDGQTMAVRVAGYHLRIVHDTGDQPTFVVQVSGNSGRAHEYRAPARGPGTLEPPLREALDAVIGAVAAPTNPSALGYSPASWASHERVWLTALGR